MAPKRTDANQAEIIRALTRAGCSVQDLSMVGQGCPDILVGRAERNYLMEIKTNDGKLNKKQKRWHSLWSGEKSVVRTVEEAFNAVGL